MIRLGLTFLVGSYFLPTGAEAAATLNYGRTRLVVTLTWRTVLGASIVIAGVALMLLAPVLAAGPAPQPIL